MHCRRLSSRAGKALVASLRDAARAPAGNCHLQVGLLTAAPHALRRQRFTSSFTHSFVLDPAVHGKSAFLAGRPGGTDFSPLALYERLCDARTIGEDAMQRRALESLEDIYEGLVTRSNVHAGSLYIFGPAGSGKSMCMDLFNFCLQQNGVRTRRQHFHEFLYEMNRKLHKLHLKERNVSTHNFIRQIARDLAKELDVLCFDEFAITSIQDCTLLVPLFTEIFATRLSFVTTSNRHPDNLYEDGLNRHLHLPAFLKILNESAKIVEIKSTDYREQAYRAGDNSTLGRVFFDSDQRLEAQELLANLGIGDLSHGADIEIGYGRRMRVESCTQDGHSAACFNLRKLLGGPPYFGADDFNAICAHFHTVVLDGLWVLDVGEHNEAKRLTNFLDCAYENHCRVICTNMADTSVEFIFANLVPLETLSLKEIVGKPVEDAAGSQGETVAQAVRRINEQQNGQQSCYFLSADHKDWSVENKVVQTSSRSRSAGIDAQSSTRRLGPKEKEEVLSRLAEELPQEPDQSGRSKPLPLDGASSADFDDPTQEQHSVKGVFVAAVASLHETGFAVKRAVSRLKEMQTAQYWDAHRTKRLQSQGSADHNCLSPLPGALAAPGDILPRESVTLGASM